MAQHDVIKPEKLAAHAAGVLAGEVVVPNLMTKKGIEDYRGAKDDTVSTKVRGVLPARKYAWRSGAGEGVAEDGSTERAQIEFDTLEETKVDVTFGGNVYSAVHVTDEQAEMDFASYAEILNPQAEAVGRGLENEAVEHLESAPYQVTIPVEEDPTSPYSPHRSFVEARRCLNLLRAPAEQRIMLVGSSFEAALLNDDKFNRADSVGEAAANTALRQATIRNWMGFTVIASTEIDPDAAYAFVPSAFVFLSAAPAVPSSVPFGAGASYNGIAMRWLRDYDSEYQRDRSVVNTWAGFATTLDSIVAKTVVDGGKPQKLDEVFVRGVRLGLGADPVYPAAGSELQEITGLTQPTTPGS